MVNEEAKLLTLSFVFAFLAPPSFLLPPPPFFFWVCEYVCVVVLLGAWGGEVPGGIMLKVYALQLFPSLLEMFI